MDPYILFLIYVNYLSDGVLNITVRLFADDCNIYRPIRCKKDTELLRFNLNSFGYCMGKDCSYMQFNADKCFTMRASRSKTRINASYKLHDQPLQSTESVTYLDLPPSFDLNFNSHISNVTAKADSVPGLMRGNLTISSQAVKTQAYQSWLGISCCVSQ